MLLSGGLKKSSFYSCSFCWLPVTFGIDYLVHTCIILVSTCTVLSHYSCVSLVPVFHRGFLGEFKINLDLVWTHFNLNTSVMTLFYMIVSCKYLIHRNKGSGIQYILLGNTFQSTTLPQPIVNCLFPYVELHNLFQVIHSPHVLSFKQANSYNTYTKLTDSKLNACYLV